MVATTGISSWASSRSRIDGLTRRHVADVAELGRALGRQDQAGVLAGDADGDRAVDVDGRDDVPVDLADQHHPGDVEGLGVGDPQAVAKLGHLAEPGHELADLRAAAVDDEGVHADRAHEHDVLGEGRQSVTTGGAASDSSRLAATATGQGVAPVLDDDDLAPEAADVRQGLDQDAGLDGRVGIAGGRRSRRPHVLVDVGVGEIDGEDGRLAVAEAEVGDAPRAGARP